MLLKNLLITTLWLVIPVTVYAAISLCGSVSAVVENWKGEVRSENLDAWADYENGGE